MGKSFIIEYCFNKMIREMSRTNIEGKWKSVKSRNNMRCTIYVLKFRMIQNAKFDQVIRIIFVIFDFVLI